MNLHMSSSIRRSSSVNISEEKHFFYLKVIKNVLIIVAARDQRKSRRRRRERERSKLQCLAGDLLLSCVDRKTNVCAKREKEGENEEGNVEVY